MPIALTAIVAERATGMISALRLAGMIHARNGAKPRMPRLGTEQMRYIRSRPWRPRALVRQPCRSSSPRTSRRRVGGGCL